MSTRSQRTSRALDIMKNKQNIDRTLSGNLSISSGKKETADTSTGGRKDSTPNPAGKMSLPNGGRMHKDPHRMLKDVKKEEEEEEDFFAIEEKIFEGQPNMLHPGRHSKTIQHELSQRKRKIGTDAVRREMEKERSKKKKEEEEEVAVVKKEEENNEEPRRLIKKEKDKEKCGIRNTENLKRSVKKEVRVEMAVKKEEENNEESRKLIKKEKNKEKQGIRNTENLKRSVKKEVKVGNTSKMSLKEEKEGSEREERTKNTFDNTVRKKRGRELSPEGKKYIKNVDKEREKKIKTETPERRNTDKQREQQKRDNKENETQKRRESSKRHRRHVTSNRQTEQCRDNAKQRKAGKTSEPSNRPRMKSEGSKNRGTEEEESERKRIEAKRRDAGKKQDGRDKGKNNRGRRGKKAEIQASDSEMSDWEEVGEMEGVDEVKELLSQGASSSQGEGEGGGVRIELDAPETLWGMRKRRKRRTEEQLIEDYLRRKVNETIRTVTQNVHKVHLLCLLAHGRYLNSILGSGTLLGAALSTTPGRNAHPPGRLDLTHLERLVRWFDKKFPCCDTKLEKDYWDVPVDEVLVRRFGSGEVRSVRESVLCFVVLCRALGISARLVLALQPLPWKPSPSTLIKPTKTETNKNEETVNAQPSSSESLPSSSHSTNGKVNSEQRKKSNAKKPNRKMLSSDSETSPINAKSGRRRGGVGMKRRKTEEDEEEEKEEEEEEDSDFEPQNTKSRMPIKIQKRRMSQEEKNKKEEKKRKERKTNALVEWAEVFVEEEEKWVCVDVSRGKIHCVAEIEAKMPSGSAYITAFNPDLTVKDVTLRYVSSWLSSEKKLRCCSEWWAETLHPFRGQRTNREKEEDEEMKKVLLLQPLPTTVAEYKNHPLYALQRHLLKFEAIYPPDVSPAGFFKGEPVYPRSSIHKLHSRETWTKEAMSVRDGEEPYKIVKARPKWDRVTCQVIKDRPLELFGEWQVKDYEPPVASGGKVPRNEYGNVELFKPTMLPRGCVHISVSGLNRLARKLNIDCAPAMVGFDFHSGWTHPVFDGYVVCEEFKDVLMDAWNQEQEEQARRAEEKRQKRIYDSWRKLIKGVLVRERVRQDYQVSSEEEEEDEEGKKRKTKKKEEEDKETANKSTVDAVGNRRKVKQADIDSLERENENKKTGDEQEEEKDSDLSSSHDRPRPPLITHQVKNLSIDLTSNVVEMAKKSRQRTMKTKNSVKRPVGKGRKRAEGGQEKSTKVRAKDEKVKQGQEMMAGLSEESEESDEEAKKEKIREILNWGHGGHAGDPDLSDDSDRDDTGTEGQSSNSTFLGFSHLPGSRKLPQKTAKRKPRNTEKNKSQAESETDCSLSSSRSTTPEPDVAVPDGRRRLSSRSAKRRVHTYKEEEKKESDADISLDDESDFEDRTYKPVKNN